MPRKRTSDITSVVSWMSGSESVATSANAVAASGGHSRRLIRKRALPHATKSEQRGVREEDDRQVRRKVRRELPEQRKQERVAGG